ncbi:MAG: bifunctional phosphoserine phosphatase/homoserine phosphotransferase ThrH [Treponema sp.]|jgi:phosphoserine/homoserine phosphotransferase|nr:bifunctional phosphoserine phosphatase/homoserine phosphotransferase ThrH [Treponema sp.]
MRIVCLDLEGVLVPEIWIAFAEAVGLPELRRTTRDEPDYDALMRFRIGVLRREGLKLPDIQRVIAGLSPLEGALGFTRQVRAAGQLIILSDTFEEFAMPLMARLEYPTLFCNGLEVAPDGAITGYRLRQTEGKKRAVEALRGLNMEVFAAGDSFNDLAMIGAASAGCLFRPPAGIRETHSSISAVDTYEELFAKIAAFFKQ